MTGRPPDSRCRLRNRHCARRRSRWTSLPSASWDLSLYFRRLAHQSFDFYRPCIGKRHDKFDGVDGGALAATLGACCFGRIDLRCHPRRSTSEAQSASTCCGPALVHICPLCEDACHCTGVRVVSSRLLLVWPRSAGTDSLSARPSRRDGRVKCAQRTALRRRSWPRGDRT